MLMSEQKRLQKIQNLKNERYSIMCCYSSMKACQQDRLDDRLGEIETELKELNQEAPTPALVLN